MVSPPEGKTIGKVKATVWDSLSGMTPLAASKTLVPGNEPEEESTPTPTPTPEPTDTTIDGSLINDQTGYYPGVDAITTSIGDSIGVIRIKKSTDTTQSKATEYDIKNAELYVNGIKFCDIDSSTADDVQQLLKNSMGMTTLVKSEDDETVYNKIYMDYYVIASVNQVKADSKSTELRLTDAVYPTVSGAQAPGTSLKIDADNLSDGDVVVNVVKAGEAVDISSIAKNDVVALKYNIKDTLSAFGSGFTTVDIIATTDTASGKCSSYDSDTELYNIGGIEYEAVKPLYLTLGTTYTFRLDPFGRLFDAEEEVTTVNYAILEKYVDDPSTYGLSAEYGYLDVVTLDGQSKRLYIDNNAKATVNANMNSAGFTPNTRLGTVKNIDERIIEYKAKTSTGRVNSVAISTNMVSFTSATYKKGVNRLYKPLTYSAVVLDATDYDVSDPYASDYKASSLSQLSEGIVYDGILVHKNNNNEWCYVIITTAGATYSKTSDFVVVAAKASTKDIAIVDDEEVYTLTVMQNGDNEATKLNVSMSADLYVNGTKYAYSSYCRTYLKEGAVFYYTTDTYGQVDRIDVVFEGGLDYDAIKVLTNSTMADKVYTPAKTEIKYDTVNDKHNTWFVTVDKRANVAIDEQIQLFIAPVMTASTSYITFGTMKQDSNGWYVDTNYEYDFSLADDAKVYAYDLDEIGTGKNAFSGGKFTGFNIREATADGKAYMTNVSAGEINFDGLVQYALCMAVDGVITNALLFNA